MSGKEAVERARERRGKGTSRPAAGARSTLYAVLCAGLLLGLAAMLAPAMAEAYLTSGISGGPRSLYGYSGVIWTPFNPLNDDGAILRGWSKGARFSYRTDLPAMPHQRIDVSGVGLAAEAGWQWHLFGARLALLAGGVWRDHKLSPADPGSSLAGSKFGWSMSFDADWPASQRLGIMADGNYIGLIDQYWIEAKPYYRFEGGLRAGPDFAISGGDNYLKARAGVFITGYEVHFSARRRLFLGGQAGAEFDVGEGHLAPFAGINIGFFY